METSEVPCPRLAEWCTDFPGGMECIHFCSSKGVKGPEQASGMRRNRKTLCLNGYALTHMILPGVTTTSCSLSNTWLNGTEGLREFHSLHFWWFTSSRDRLFSWRKYGGLNNGSSCGLRPHWRFVIKSGCKMLQHWQHEMFIHSPSLFKKMWLKQFPLEGTTTWIASHPEKAPTVLLSSSLSSSWPSYQSRQKLGDVDPLIHDMDPVLLMDPCSSFLWWKFDFRSSYVAAMPWGSGVGRANNQQQGTENEPRQWRFMLIFVARWSRSLSGYIYCNQKGCKNHSS